MQCKVLPMLKCRPLQRGATQPDRPPAVRTIFHGLQPMESRIPLWSKRARSLLTHMLRSLEGRKIGVHVPLQGVTSGQWSNPG
jgi:hypothetical protein